MIPNACLTHIGILNKLNSSFDSFFDLLSGATNREFSPSCTCNAGHASLACITNPAVYIQRGLKL